MEALREMRLSPNRFGQGTNYDRKPAPRIVHADILKLRPVTLLSSVAYFCRQGQGSRNIGPDLAQNTKKYVMFCCHFLLPLQVLQGVGSDSPFLKWLQLGESNAAFKVSSLEPFFVTLDG